MSVNTESAMTLTLPSELEFMMTRTFDAPRELVFDAWTKPEHLTQWWGCRSSTMPVCEIDLRVGGTYRFVTHLPDGGEFGFNGIYRELEPPARLVFTQVFEPMPQHEALITTAFEEQDGKTLVIETILHKSMAARDGHLNSGMEAGASETFDRLAEYLQTMVKGAA